jgi:cardiolipin synthase
MRMQLLVDAAEFRESLAADLAAARFSAFVQALTFEGDVAGRSVAALLARSPARDRRVLVDSYTRHVLSDRFRWRPRNLLSARLWREAWATRRMFRDLGRQGVVPRFVNPAGPLFWHFAARNHKKLVVVDGRVAYVGGINFSDHNFAWHDLMVRLEDARVGGFLAEDFLATWEGRDRAGSLRLPGLTLHALDGRRNEAVFDEILELLAQAQDEIYLQCPYVSDPFTQELRRAARRGARVTVLMPEHHNFPLLRQGLARVAAESPVDLRLYPERMTHMKALLVDRRWLVLGSANFDVWSYHSQQEYVAVLTEPGIVGEFRRRVVEPDLARSKRALPLEGDRDSRGLEARLAGLALLATLGARHRGSER